MTFAAYLMLSFWFPVMICRSGWTRVIVEKPFGKDTESFNKLSADLYQHLSEEQMYRIDHYLGKELIENLTVCPCSWRLLPWWPARLRNVVVTFKDCALSTMSGPAGDPTMTPRC